MSPPRIAILGFKIECNRFCKPATRHDFEIDVWQFGQAVCDGWNASPPHTPKEVFGFLDDMAKHGGCEPIPIAMACAAPSGAVNDAVLLEFLKESETRLRAAGALDGVLCVMHGAAITEGDEDPDGVIVAMVRQIVGPDVAVIGTYDLHANISNATVAALDGFVGYLTNPHVDMAERGAEAAALMRTRMAGTRLHVRIARLPLVVPTITMLTSPAQGLFAEMVEQARQYCVVGRRHACVMGGFPHSDTSKNGVAVLVTADEPGEADRIAHMIAAHGWEQRTRFAHPLVSLAEGVRRAVEVGNNDSRERIILADLGDNPGGGAPATSTIVLDALIDAGAKRFVLGIMHDPKVALEAHRAGLDGSIAAFGRHATVVALGDGRFTGLRGLSAGSKIDMGLSCKLAIAGGLVIVATHRLAANDIGHFVHMGISLDEQRTIVLKSRGHFRASFDLFVRPENVLELDTPGMTSPNLSTFAWTRISPEKLLFAGG